MRVEFVGGPYDGEVRDVGDPPLPLVVELPALAAGSPIKHTYRACVDGAYWHESLLGRGAA